MTTVNQLVEERSTCKSPNSADVVQLVINRLQCCMNHCSVNYKSTDMRSDSV